MLTSLTYKSQYLILCQGAAIKLLEPSLWIQYSAPSQHSALPDLRFLYKVCACVLSRFSRVQLFVTVWTVAQQAPLSMGILQAWILEWVAMPSSRGSSWPKDQSPSLVSPALAGRFFPTSTTWEGWWYLHKAVGVKQYLVVLCLSD